MKAGKVTSRRDARATDLTITEQGNVTTDGPGKRCIIHKRDKCPIQLKDI